MLDCAPWICRRGGLEEHYERMGPRLLSDFKVASLVELVASELDAGLEVLDLGCGICAVTAGLQRKGFKVSSVDGSESMAALGRKILAAAGLDASRVTVSGLGELAASSPGRFDQIVCLDVIEHIEDDAAALSSIFTRLKPGGLLVLSVPALPALYGPMDRRIGHYRRYSEAGLRQRLAAQPAVLEKLRYWNLLGVPVSWLYARVLHGELDQDFRYRRGGLKSLKQALLKAWFLRVENPSRFPLGLTLFAVLRKR